MLLWIKFLTCIVFVLQLRNQNLHRQSSRFKGCLLSSFERLAASARRFPETWPGKQKSKIGKRNSSALPSLSRLFHQDASGQSALYQGHPLAMPGRGNRSSIEDVLLPRQDGAISPLSKTSSCHARTGQSALYRGRPLAMPRRGNRPPISRQTHALSRHVQPMMCRAIGP